MTAPGLGCSRDLGDGETPVGDVPPVRRCAMRIAVAGGTGVVGRYAVAAGEAAGHEVAVLSRGRGVDARIGAGLEAALDRVDVVIDALNVMTQRGSQAEAFFTETSRNLQEAGS